MAVVENTSNERNLNGAAELAAVIRVTLHGSPIELPRKDR
jgi:hypothetical protein